jgi:predicted nucleic acid-binding Zn ribbon protein
MDDGTSGQSACEVCGEPIRVDNTLGVCSDKDKPECARLRKHRERDQRKPPGTPEWEPKHCEVCGRLLRADSTYGVCSETGTPECTKEYQRRQAERRRLANPKPEPKLCEICGTPLRADNKYGVCSGVGARDSLACRLERARRVAAQKPESEAVPFSRPASRVCEVCGRPIRSDNRTGVCQRSDSIECIKTRARKLRNADLQAAGRACEVCGGSLRVDNIIGICRRTPECVRARDARYHAQRDELQAKRRASADRPEPIPLRKKTPKRGSVPVVNAGDVYGKLTVLESTVWATEFVQVRCECGTETKRQASSVRDGRVKSCGCLHGTGKRTHGLSSHPLYGIWRGIIGRTTDPDHPAYPDYGGRGITVCERWQGLPGGFLNFAADMGPRPGREFSVERTDNEKGYGPDNCVWASKSQQNMNKRKVRMLTAERDAAIAEAEALTATLAAAERRIAELEGCLR